MCKRFIRGNACKEKWGRNQRRLGELADDNAGLTSVKKKGNHREEGEKGGCFHVSLPRRADAASPYR